MGTVSPNKYVCTALTCYYTKFGRYAVMLPPVTYSIENFAPFGGRFTGGWNAQTALLVDIYCSSLKPKQKFLSHPIYTNTRKHTDQ